MEGAAGETSVDEYQAGAWQRFGRFSDEAARHIGAVGSAYEKVAIARTAVRGLPIGDEDPTNTHEEALLKIYQRLRPGNPPQLEKARELFKEKFQDPNRYRLGKGDAPVLHRLMRHSSMQITMDFYASVDDVLHDAIRQLDQSGGNSPSFAPPANRPPAFPPADPENEKGLTD